QLPGRLAARNAVRRRLEAPDESLHSLQERVVKLACNPLTLGEARLQSAAHLCRNLTHSHAIQQGQYRDDEQRAQRIEPPGLIERRRDREGERSAGVVPDAIVVGGGYAKRVMAGAEVRVGRLASRSDVLPRAIRAFELVAEANALRDRETAGAV